MIGERRVVKFKMGKAMSEAIEKDTVPAIV